MSRIDELREKLTPEQWLQGLRANRATYQEQLVTLLTDRDVIATSTTMETKHKEDFLSRVDTQLLEVDARITEIDERLEAAGNGAMGLPRTVRRRLKAQNEKKAKGGQVPAKEE